MALLLSLNLLAIWAFASGPVVAEEAPKSKAKNPPRFEDFPVSDMFRGEPALPITATSAQREFRTAIRNGVTKGWGVSEGGEGKERPGPNFAGHYIVVRWGCGAGCLRMAVVDAATGEVHDPPMSISKGDPLALPMCESGWAAYDFRLTSRLFKMEACSEPRKPGSPCYAYYFVIDKDGWHLIRRKRLRTIMQ
jgi:hypothetical protein